MMTTDGSLQGRFLFLAESGHRWLPGLTRGWRGLY